MKKERKKKKKSYFMKGLFDWYKPLFCWKKWIHRRFLTLNSLKQAQHAIHTVIAFDIILSQSLSAFFSSFAGFLFLSLSLGLFLFQYCKHGFLFLRLFILLFAQARTSESFLNLKSSFKIAFELLLMKSKIKLIFSRRKKITLKLKTTTWITHNNFRFFLVNQNCNASSFEF